MFNLFTKFNLAQPSETFYYLDEAEKIASKTGADHFLKSIWNVKAEIYQQQMKLDSAAFFLSKVIEDSANLDFNAIKVLASVFNKMNQPDKSIPFIMKGVSRAHAANIEFEKRRNEYSAGRSI